MCMYLCIHKHTYVCRKGLPSWGFNKTFHTYGTLLEIYLGIYGICKYLNMNFRSKIKAFRFHMSGLIENSLYVCIPTTHSHT